MSLSDLTSAARRAIFSSIRDAADDRFGDDGACGAGAAFSSAFGGWAIAAAAAAAAPAFTSLPQLMQVVLSASLTCTPLHFGHGSFVRVPPLTSSEAADLILAALSSDIYGRLLAAVEFFLCDHICMRETTRLNNKNYEKCVTRWRLSAKNAVSRTTSVPVENLTKKMHELSSALKQEDFQRLPPSLKASTQSRATCSASSRN